MRCRATDCLEEAKCSGLCEEHYKEWRTMIDAHKSVKQQKDELKERYPNMKPRFTNLGEFL